MDNKDLLIIAKDMSKFSDRDIDRHWSQKELNELSERDLTVLAFHKNLKNVIFFGVQAIVVYLIVGKIGKIGFIVGWISIGLLIILAIEPLIATVTSLVVIIPSIFISPSNIIWRVLQLLIALLSFAIYASLAVIIYLKMY